MRPPRRDGRTRPQRALFDHEPGYRGEPADLLGLPSGGQRERVVGPVGERPEHMALVAFEPFGRPLPGRVVDADVGHAPEPPLGLCVQVRVTGERAAVGEALADVADGPLDLPRRLRPVGPAGPGPEAPVDGEAEELGVLGHAPTLASQIPHDHALHLVEQEVLRHAAEEGEGRLQRRPGHPPRRHVGRPRGCGDDEHPHSTKAGASAPATSARQAGDGR